MNRFARLVVLFVFILTGIGAIPAAGQVQQPGQPTPLAPAAAKMFLPIIRSIPSGYQISGQVTDENGNPLSGVSISDGAGGGTITAGDGSYQLSMPQDSGVASLAAEKGVIGFAPTTIDLDLQGNASNLDFIGMAECAELIENGGFETNSFWALNGAVYDTVTVNNGLRALRLGPDLDASSATGAVSALTPAFTIPADAKDPLLRLWLYTRSVSPGALAPSVASVSDNFFGPNTDANDLQAIRVLDANGGTLETLWEGKGQNNQDWGLVQYNLYKYSGQTIRLGLFVTNDGFNSLTSLYVDDVTLVTCPTIMAPDLGDTGIAAVEAPDACANQIINPGFENNKGWGIPNTAFPAGYTTSPVFSGARAMRTGIVNTFQNRYSYSDAWQTVFIPSNAASATLRLVNRMISNDPTATSDDPAVEPDLAQSDPHFATGAVWAESALANDMMYVLILNPSNGTILQTLRTWSARNVNWTVRSWDLMAFRGMNIRIQFGAFNDGWGGVTAMFVDDLTVDVCAGALPPPPPSSACPAGQTLRLANTGFEQAGGWYIPVTAYSARYTNQKAFTGSRSMLTGIVNPFHNRYSYSDFAQYTVIPSGSIASLNFFANFKSNDVGFDRQYLLVLNNWGYWIDTLMWKSSRNSAGWVQVPINMTGKPYNGWPIRLQFGAFNNGWGGITAMYIDDVTLCTIP